MFPTAVCVTSFVYLSANLFRVFLGLLEGVMRDAHAQVTAGLQLPELSV